MPNLQLLVTRQSDHTGTINLPKINQRVRNNEDSEEIKNDESSGEKSDIKDQVTENDLKLNEGQDDDDVIERKEAMQKDLAKASK